METNKGIQTTRQEDNLKEIIRSGEIMGRFAEVVGDGHASGYISSVLIAVKSNDLLQKCTVDSIITSALRAATMKLSVDPSTGQAYLVPFSNHGVYQAALVVGYKGIYQMALRTNKYQSINVIDVYDNETLIEDRMTGDITFERGGCKFEPGQSNRKLQTGKVVGYMLYFKLVSGFSKTIYMTTEECIAHGKKYSKNFMKSDGSVNRESMWYKDPAAMYRKTVIRLLSKWGYMDPYDLLELSRSDDENVIDIQPIDTHEVSPQLPAETPEPKQTAKVAAKKEEPIDIKPIKETEPETHDQASLPIEGMKLNPTFEPSVVQRVVDYYLPQYKTMTYEKMVGVLSRCELDQDSSYQLLVDWVEFYLTGIKEGLPAIGAASYANNKGIVK